jgi:hypothetical protein
MAPVQAVQRLVAGQEMWTVTVLEGVDHHPLLRETATCLALIRSTAESAGPAKRALDVDIDGVRALVREII